MKMFLKNRRGIALPLVIILFAVGFILTATTLSVVNFDDKHSIIDEKQTKAYYLARSAVDTVFKAVDSEIYALNVSKANVKDLAKVYNDDPTTVNLSNYSNALTQYNNKKGIIESNILPTAGTPYSHTVTNDADLTTLSTVEVTYVSGVYRFAATETVGDISAKAVLHVGIPEGTEYYQLLIGTPGTPGGIDYEEYEIDANSPAAFNDALYAYGNMNLDHHVKLVKPGGSNATGRYRGVPGGKALDNKGSSHLVGDISKDTSDSNKTPIEPSTLLPIDIATDNRFIGSKGSALPETITHSDSGYYTLNPITNSSTIKKFNVDTSGGNVIIKTNRLHIDSNNVEFNVTGNNHFYIYIDDNNLTNGGLYVKNNIKITSHDNTPRTFIIVNQDSSDRDPSKNLIDIKNNENLYAFIYAPYTTLEIKNNAKIFGSVIARNIVIKNNLDVVYMKPSSGSYSYDGDGNQIIKKEIITAGTPGSSILADQPLDTIVTITPQWMPK